MTAGRLRVLILGCGNIAGRFDSERGRFDEPLTHAGAYAKDGRFDIAACVEPDDSRRQDFMRNWKVPFGARAIDSVLREGERFDIISICTPTDRHPEDLAAAIDLGPRGIFCEKPVSGCVADTEKLVELCKRRGISLAVNYTRRWDPSVTELRDAIRERRWGRLRTAVAYYNKGLLNNGSHMLDLLNLLLGSLRLIWKGRPIADFVPEDPTFPAWLEAESGVPVLLTCGHAQDFALSELQLVFAKAVLTMEEGGMYWRLRVPADSSAFKGYRVLDGGTRSAGGYPQAMLRSVGNLFGSVTRGDPLASTGESALVTQRLCEEIRDQ